eukprot:IDg3035t1
MYPHRHETERSRPALSVVQAIGACKVWSSDEADCNAKSSSKFRRCMKSAARACPVWVIQIRPTPGYKWS